MDGKDCGYNGVSILHKVLPYLSYKDVWCMPTMHALLYGVVAKFVKYIFRPLQDTSRRGIAKALSEVKAAEAKFEHMQVELVAARREVDRLQRASRSTAKARNDAAAIHKTAAKSSRDAATSLADLQAALRVAKGEVVLHDIVSSAGRTMVKAAAATVMSTSEFGKGYRCFLKYR